MQRSRSLVAAASLAVLLALSSSAASAAGRVSPDATIDRSGKPDVDDEYLAPFPRTIEEIPEDFVFLPVAGEEDRSEPVEPTRDESESAARAWRAPAPQAITSPIRTAGTCQYRDRSDNIHITSGEVSVHAWWDRVSSPASTCPSKANVEVWLQAYGCGSLGCGWVTIANNNRNVYAGGGSSRWVNARRACANTNPVAFREQVDVDLIDWPDPSGYSQGPEVQRNCYPT